jgi:hypothetical protein
MEEIKIGDSVISKFGSNKKVYKVEEIIRVNGGILARIDKKSYVNTEHLKKVYSWRSRYER